MPKKILVLVEGQTEEGFVKRVLGPYLSKKDIYLIPTIIKTKREVRGPDHKGGVNSYLQVKSDLTNLFGDTSATLITTMIDYYALPTNFPGYDKRPNGSCYQRIEFMEKKFEEDISNEKFLPYLQLHEFEALVFASSEKISTAFIKQSANLAKVAEINNSFSSPEEINESPESAPSKRLKAIFPEYQKTFHSQLILSQIGIDDLRKKCSHFDSWLSNLES